MMPAGSVASRPHTGAMPVSFHLPSFSPAPVSSFLRRGFAAAVIPPVAATLFVRRASADAANLAAVAKRCISAASRDWEGMGPSHVRTQRKPTLNESGRNSLPAHPSVAPSSTTARTVTGPLTL